MKTAFATKEVGLGPTVTPVGEATAVTPLGSMPGVYSDNLAADSFSLILKKSLELSKAPGVKPPFGFPPAGFDTAPDVGEVFNNDSRAGLNAIKDRSGQDVVAIPSEALFMPSEASKVPLSTLSTFGLQLASEAKDTFNDFLCVSIAMKAVIGSYGGAGYPQVNTNSMVITNESNVSQNDDSVQVEMPLAIDEVGGSSRIARRILGIFRKVERYLHPAVRSRQADKPLIPVYFEGMQVIPGWTGYRLRALSLAPLLQPGNCRPHGFTGFVYGLNMQVRNKIRQDRLAIPICQTVQGIGVTRALLPTSTTNGIEHLGKLTNRLMQCFSLFVTGLKLHSYCSIHTKSIPHITEFLQEKEVCHNSSVT